MATQATTIDVLVRERPAAAGEDVGELTVNAAGSSVSVSKGDKNTTFQVVCARSLRAGFGFGPRDRLREPIVVEGGVGA